MCPTILNPLPISIPTSSLSVSQSTSYGCPASCIQFALVIYFIYGNIHVSMLFSYIVPSLLSPILCFQSISKLYCLNIQNLLKKKKIGHFVFTPVMALQSNPNYQPLPEIFAAYTFLPFRECPC